MNRRQRFALMVGLALTFWFGLIADVADYRRYLTATVLLTAGSLLLFHGSIRPPGRFRRMALGFYQNSRVRIVLCALLATAVVGIVAPRLYERMGYHFGAGPGLRDVEHRFKVGETFPDVLTENGVSAANAAQWTKAASRLYALSQIEEGQVLSMRVDDSTSDLVSMRMGIDVATCLVAHRKDGQVVAQREAVAMVKVRRVVEGTIEGGFSASAARTDIPDEIISETTGVLGWDLDFEKLKAGSRFSIQFEELRNPDGVGTLPGQLLSVKIVEAGGGKVHEGIWFQAPGENYGAYYTSNGLALGRAYLRYPIQFTRIVRNDEGGVDFVAAAGTSVRAIADGRVELVDTLGEDGRYVQIRHDDVVVSGYGHMLRVADGISPRSWVRQGTVIGYVGAVGFAKESHLNFVMYKDGKSIDPLSNAAPRSRSLPAEYTQLFSEMVRKIEAAYTVAERAGGSLSLTVDRD